MPNKVISQLESIIGSGIAEEDILHIIDVSESELSSKNKKVTVAELGKVFGEPYFEINSTGTLPTALSNNSLSIGVSSNIDDSSDDSINIGNILSTVNSSQNISIGNDLTVDGTNAPFGGFEIINIGSRNNSTDNYNSTIIGSDIDLSNSAESIVIGNLVSVSNNASNSIVIGSYINLSSQRGIAIGTNTRATGLVEAVAIGDKAIATASKAFQLGDGTNSEEDTLQFKATKIANNFGIVAPYISVTPTSPGEINGAIKVNSTDNTLTYKSNDAWFSLSPGGSSAGEPYVNIAFTTSTTDFPLIGANSIGIGGGIDTSLSPLTVALGTNIDIENGSSNSILIGKTLSIASFSGTSILFGVDSSISDNIPNSVAIGKNVQVINSGGIHGSGVAIGTNSLSDKGAIAIRADATGDQSIAIGTAMQASGDEAIVIAGGNGSITVNQSTANASRSISLGFSVKNNNENSIGIGNNITLSTQSPDVIAIGSNTTAQNTSSISIGKNANTYGDGTGTIAIGENAVSIGNNTVQIGTGTNETTGSLQFRNHTIANEEGIQTRTGAGIPTYDAPDGSLYVDATGIKLYFRVNGNWETN